MSGARQKKVLAAEKAAESISAIALGLATGRIRLGKGFATNPESSVKLEISGKQSRRGGRVTIDVSWKAAED